MSHSPCHCIHSLRNCWFEMHVWLYITGLNLKKHNEKSKVDMQVITYTRVSVIYPFNEDHSIGIVSQGSLHCCLVFYKINRCFYYQDINWHNPNCERNSWIAESWKVHRPNDSIIIQIKLKWHKVVRMARTLLMSQFFC